MDQLLLHDMVPFYYVDPAAYQYYYPYYNEPQMEVRTVIHGDKYDDLIKIVWQREFNRLFAQMPNQSIGKWNFYHVGSCAQPSSHYYQLRDWAKVRFSCAQCGNGWTSMRGMVQFDVEIALVTQPEGIVKIGNIYATMYGQKCQKCLDERFEQAMWYPEEVTKV